MNQAFFNTSPNMMVYMINRRPAAFFFNLLKPTESYLMHVFFLDL